MNRGEIWTLRDDAYASKARPVVVLQAKLVEDFDSIILCLITSFDAGAVSTRLKIAPTKGNGLLKMSFVMTEKLLTVDRSLLGSKIGSLTEKQMSEISKKLAEIFFIRKEDLAE